MASLGKIQLIYIITAPPDQVAEGDRLFKSHQTWMAATHPRSGNDALLSYNVSKGPELSNPFDGASAPTGNTCFVLNEIYESDAGVVNHFQLAQSGWSDFAALLEWLGKCKVTGIPSAPIFNSLW